MRVIGETERLKMRERMTERQRDSAAFSAIIGKRDFSFVVVHYNILTTYEIFQREPIPYKGCFYLGFLHILLLILKKGSNHMKIIM